MALHGDPWDIAAADLTCFCFKGNTQFKMHKLTTCQQAENERQPTLQVIKSVVLCKSLISLRPLMSMVWEYFQRQLSERGTTRFCAKASFWRACIFKQACGSGDIKPLAFVSWLRITFSLINAINQKHLQNHYSVNQNYVEILEIVTEQTWPGTGFSISQESYYCQCHSSFNLNKFFCSVVYFIQCSIFK